MHGCSQANEALGLGFLSNVGCPDEYGAAAASVILLWRGKLAPWVDTYRSSPHERSHNLTGHILGSISSNEKLNVYSSIENNGTRL